MVDNRHDLQDAFEKVTELFQKATEDMEQIKGMLVKCNANIASLITQDFHDILDNAAQEAGSRASAEGGGEPLSDPSSEKNTLYCSFCGKSQHEVKKLIAGPTVFICDECIVLCTDIIREPGDAGGS